MQAAYLHVLGDLLNSVGVLLASGVIYIWPSMWYFDPICTYFFAIIVLITTRQTFWQCIEVLLESTPSSVDRDEIESGLGQIEGVDEVHDLHVWQISNDKFAFSVHLGLKNSHRN